MGQDPAAIREEIERTREHMGDTVDALGYKADVPARAKESVSGKVDSLKSKIAGLGTQVSDATPSADDVKQGTHRAVGVAQENPLGLILGAASVGFLAGTLVPSTKLEDERIGPLADQVREQAKQTGQEVVEHGRQVAQETAETATQKAQEAVTEVTSKARESTEEHAQDVADSTRESAEQLQSSARQAH
jgi:vacuolar-type H+-ATPase subunit H/ElaB/YqjD/DUF883 family membrane-anchored ribosome-binding protein